MAGYISGKVVLVFGGGGDAHRGVAVALAEAGADIAVAGLKGELSAEAALHSISNEIWALGRRSTVLTLEADDASSFANAVQRARAELGRADVVVRADAVLNA
jgi:meso-butanediol dehydrogenase / (S,S)-butanediol dehydrogenase / diacetyl reductase